MGMGDTWKPKAFSGRRIELGELHAFDRGANAFHVSCWKVAKTSNSVQVVSVIRPQSFIRCLLPAGSSAVSLLGAKGVPMWKTFTRSQSSRGLRYATVLGFAMALLPLVAQAVDLPVPVTKVEEDWELVLNEPSPDTVAPQITCLISPFTNCDSVYATLEMNHASLPEFSAGGLQLQVWSGEDWLTVRDYADTALSNTGEVITWTRRMSLGAGKLTFQTTNGSSTSWGNFGGSGTFKLSITSTLASLNGYSPDFSQSQSGIGYGSQRVQSLVLKRVRYYDALGNLITEDTTERVVHQE
jgi:hypothetical protein